jgi:ABC-type nitrate/sulfonate/bicarbonate transport system substrate-binding protein
MKGRIMTTRRTILGGALVLAALAISPVHAEDKPKEIRIGTQKGGFFPAVRQRHSVEDAFKPLGIEVKWIDFQFGPPLLEAVMSAASTSALSAIPRQSSRRPAAPRSAMWLR